MTVAEKHTDDNWGKLYQAILNFNQPLSIVMNALQFGEEVPTLVEGSGGTLTPLLSDNFDWSIPFPVFDEAPVPQLGIAPVSTAAPSPRTEDDDATSDHRKSIQSTQDIYSGPLLQVVMLIDSSSFAQSFATAYILGNSVLRLANGAVQVVPNPCIGQGGNARQSQKG